MAGLQLSGLASGMDTESIVKQLMQVEQLRVDKVDKQKKLLEMKQEVWEDMNAKLYSFYTKQVFDLKSSGTYKAKNATVSKEAYLGATATASASAGVHTVTVEKLAKASRLYSGPITDDTVKTTDVTLPDKFSFTVSDGTKSETITWDSSGKSVYDLVQAINGTDLNINASYDSVNKRIFMNSTTLGDTSQIKISGLDLTEERDFFTAMGLTADTNNEVVGVAGQNAKYTYDGVSFTGNSNTVSVNGLSLTLKAEAPAEEISINITNNTDAVYNKVKDFIKAYNELVKEMNTKISADPAKGYEPLTDTEKESLSDDVVKKWETKIKNSVLRRDQNLMNLTSSMRSIMTASEGVNVSGFPEGFQYISDIGIVTGHYSEKGILHIEGDADDSFYSAKTNKLKKAIEENPEEVGQLLAALGDKLYSTMSEKMKSSSLNSALTLYNDKQIKKQIGDYEDRILVLQERMAVTEQRYYKQFTAMEQMIQQANSKSSSLLGMLGGGGNSQ